MVLDYWMDTKYEPGTVKVIAYDKNGMAVAEKEIHTAGAPHHIELVPDRTLLQADGKDLCFVTVRVVVRKEIFVRMQLMKSVLK